MTSHSTAVAYGCSLSSIVDYNHFIAIANVNANGGSMSIISAYGTYITRGDVSKLPSKKCDESVLMKNCAILRVKIDEKNIASVKIFKQYLHICKVSLEDAEKVSDMICREMIEAQHIIRDEVKLRERIISISKSDPLHIPSNSIDLAVDYYNIAEICSLDLSHGEVIATMTNNLMYLGSAIHTTKLAKLLRDEKGYRRWVVTFDNSLSMCIRVIVLFSDNDKKGYSFAIQPSGCISYSESNNPESKMAREELHNFIQDRMDIIKL